MRQSQNEAPSPSQLPKAKLAAGTNEGPDWAPGAGGHSGWRGGQGLEASWPASSANRRRRSSKWSSAAAALRKPPSSNAPSSAMAVAGFSCLSGQRVRRGRGKIQIRDGDIDHGLLSVHLRLEPHVSLAQVRQDWQPERRRVLRLQGTQDACFCGCLLTRAKNTTGKRSSWETTRRPPKSCKTVAPWRKRWLSCFTLPRKRFLPVSSEPPRRLAESLVESLVATPCSRNGANSEGLGDEAC